MSEEQVEIKQEVEEEVKQEPMETTNGNGEAVADENASEDFKKLTEAGLTSAVATALDKIFQESQVVSSDIDERAIEALKELSEEGALQVLSQFTDSNLQHVQNKSAFLCGVMKIYRQRVKAAELNPNAAAAAGPPAEKIKDLLTRTGYSLDITTGQRRYGGPPPKTVYDGSNPGNGCQVFIGKIPRDVYEDELVPLLEKAGIIWDFRLMMDPLSGQNRGYGFASFTTAENAQAAVKEMDNHEIRPKKFLGVCVSQSNCRLFVGSIPKVKSKDEIFTEFSNLTEGLTDVIIYTQADDKTKNRGFCFLEFTDHKAASAARRRLSAPKVKAFNNSISVDWADLMEEPSQEVMAKVKVLYVKNLADKATEEVIMNTFKEYGDIDRVKKIKDYAFVHYKEREHAVKAMEELNGINIEGECVDISLAKPVDKKRQEKQRERKMYGYDNFGYGGPRGGRGRNGGGMGGGYGMRGGMGMGGGYGDGYGYGGGYDNFSEDYDYGGYGFGGGYDDGFFGMSGGPMQMPYGYNRGRGGGYGGGMYGGGFGGGRGMKRGRGGRGGGMYGGMGRGGRGGKRKATDGAAGRGGKKPNNMQS